MGRSSPVILPLAWPKLPKSLALPSSDPTAPTNRSGLSAAEHFSIVCQLYGGSPNALSCRSFANASGKRTGIRDISEDPSNGMTDVRVGRGGLVRWGDHDLYGRQRCGKE